MQEQENEEKKPVCEVCDGSGQICSFKGVSRFALSWEDCPVCGGMGFLLPGDEEQEPAPNKDKGAES